MTPPGAPPAAGDGSRLRSGIRGGYLNLAVTWLVQALLVPLLLRHLGRDAFGLYATLTSVVGYFALLTLGSALTVPRTVAEHAARGEEEALGAFVSTYAVVHVVIALLGAAAGWALAPFVAEHLAVPEALRGAVAPAWRLVVGGWALGLLGGLFQSFLTGLGDVALANLASSVRALLMLLAAVAVLLAGGDLGALLSGLLGASLAGTVVAFALLRARHPALRVRFAQARLATLRATARPAALFFLMQVAALVVMGTDNVIIGAVLGVGEVAPYAVAFQLWSLATAVLWSGMDGLLPFFTRWDARGDAAELRHAFLSAMRWSFAGACLLAIVIAASGQSLVRWWVGGALAVRPGLLAVFAAMLLTATPIHVAALLLSALGKHKPAALGGAAEAALNLGLSLALVRPLGVLGVALGTLVSGALTNAWIAPRAALRALGLDAAALVRGALLPALPPAVLAGIPAALFARRVAPGSVPAAALLGAVVALFAVAFWFGSLDEPQRREAQALMRR